MEDRYNVECCEFMHAHDEIVERVQKEMPGEDTLYDLTELFRIFGDSTRIRILYVLFEAEMCVCDIAALLGMTAVGALIAAVPKLLRNRGSYWACESALGCAGAFLYGVGMMMGLHLAGSGRIVSAMLEGSTGAFGFVIMAWIAGCVTALLAGRRRA